MSKARNSNTRTAFVTISIIGLLLGLSACGQKGRLYLSPASTKTNLPEVKSVDKALPDNSSMKEKSDKSH